ncbi:MULTISPECIES: hypothetical protein [unclassified Methylobacterium]|uniref:hypothetical protein n=1 Tax=unclassified Methylobacterium TaxID=2615210 RepID=UPI00226AE512|nr:MULTISPECIES: hypothetical protein [unclassified Methylobacterium]
MITSYEVGAVYRIVDQASPTLLKIVGLLEKVSGLSKQVEAHFSGIGAVKLGGLNKSLSTLDKHLTGVAEKAGVAREGLVSSFAKADTSINTTTAAVAKLTAELAAAKTEAAGLRIPAGGGGRVRPGQGGFGGGGSRAGGHGSSSAAGHTGLQLGVMGFFGAEAVGHGLKDVLQHASELEHVQQQMIQGGFKEVNIAKARNAAWAEAGKYGLNVAKVLGDIKELTLPFGSIEHAIEFIEPLEKMKIVLNGVSEGKGNASAEAVYKMARAGELKGLQDPKDFLSYFENMTKAISASGGKITPNDFMQATKYSKLSGMGFSEEYFTKYLPTLIQTMGASTAGTASQSLFSTLVQGTVTKRALGRMDDLGLIGDPSKIIYDNKGDPKGFNPGAVQGTELLVSNPFKWAQTVLLPLLEKKYGSIDDPANKQKAIEDLGGLFGNRNSAAAIAELALRGKTFNKDAALIEQARGLGGADQLQKEDPNSSAARLHGAWENLLTAIGGPGVSIAVAGMNSLATGITAITKVANEHPGAMKIVLEGVLGLAGALAAITVGGALVGAAVLAPTGAVVVAVTTLVGVLGSIAAFNWKSLLSALDAADKAFNDAALALGTEIKSWPGKLASAIAEMGTGLVTAIGDMLKSLFSKLNPFSKTAFESGEGFGGLIHSASFGGGANDNFGGASGVGRALGRSGTGGIVPRGAFGPGTGAGDSWYEAIMRAEGTAGKDPYNVVLGNGRYGLPSKPLTDMSLAEAYQFGRSVRARHGSSSAIGAFQIVGQTMKSFMGEAGLGWNDKFSPENQRKLAEVIRRHQGFGAWEGFKVHPGELRHARELHPYGQQSAPTASAPPKPHHEELHVHNVYMDGEKIERHVTRRQVAKMRFPSSVGGTDSYGNWHGPGTAGTKVA